MRGSKTQRLNLIMVGVCLALAAVCQGQTTATRVANTTLRMPAHEPVEGFGLTNALGDLVFTDPVVITAPPGETNRLFIAERTGLIYAITNLAAPTKTLFLDLRENLYSSYFEAGLLGMTFHPGYRTNGYFFVYRTLITTTGGAVNTLHDQLSRFQVSPVDSSRAQKQSEVRILAQYDDLNTHNGGDIHFGPDGYLYVALGDESPPPGERQANKQPIDESFFAGILRIDVDKREGNLPPNPHPAVTENYLVPRDNPFIGSTIHNELPVNAARLRTEFFAIGFRNPWRMSFDPVTGELYCGDVGAGLLEEVNLVVAGRNYGWPFREGPFAGDQGIHSPLSFPSAQPLYLYFHGYGKDQGKAIIGGVVYRGRALAQLEGAYLFGDNVSGNIWALRHAGGELQSVEWLVSEPGISTFGRDPRDGEVLVANFREGRIKRLVHVPPELQTSLPRTLRDTGAFADLTLLTPNPGIEAYQINVPFWSDHALKSRWFSVPDPARTIQYQNDEPWTFPEGTVWIKHFDLELTNGVASSRHRLETRLLVKSEEGIYGVTYRWGGEGNARLVPPEGLDETFLVTDGALVRTQLWHYPARHECRACHTRAGGYALGFNTEQLNRTSLWHGRQVNQIQALTEAGYLERPPGDRTLPKLARASDETQSLQLRARSYLAANCSQCHQPQGSAEVLWDARLRTPISQAGIIDGPLLYNFGDRQNRVITPGSLSRSMLMTRLSHPGVYRMPPIGSTQLDPAGISLLTEWIETFPEAPWSARDIGVIGQQSGSSIRNGVFEISGAGGGIGDKLDGFHYLSRPLRGNGQIVARLRSFPNEPGSVAGLMFRDSTSGSSPYAMMRHDSADRFFFQRRRRSGEPAFATPPVSSPAVRWQRLVREGNLFTAYSSADGTNWSQVGFGSSTIATEAMAGLAVSTPDGRLGSFATFDQVGLLSVRLASPANGSMHRLPAELILQPEIEAVGNAAAGVEYFSGTNKIGGSRDVMAPFAWNDATVGTHSIRARVTDSAGMSVFSEPVLVTIESPAPTAQFAGLAADPGIDWRQAYGLDGYLVATGEGRLPDFVLMAGERNDWWRELVQAGLGQEMVKVELGDGALHRVTLGMRRKLPGIQTMEVLESATGRVLNRQSFYGLTGLSYLTWNVRGAVTFQISGVGAGTGAVWGVFFDPSENKRPEVRITSPAQGLDVPLPSSLTLVADARDSDGSVASVAFFANGRELCVVDEPPFSCLADLGGYLAGPLVIHARAVDNLGDFAESAPVTIHLRASEASAAFVKSDKLTHGAWRGQYGLDGFVLPAHATNTLATVEMQLPDAELFTWVENTTEVRALQRATNEGRIASTWFSQNHLEFELNFLDGKNHLVAMYFLDWEFADRVLQVEVFDAATGRLLRGREVSEFGLGEYLVWTIQGHVRVLITRVRGGNAVLSGLFFETDTNEPPLVKLVSPASPVTLTVPNRLKLAAEAADPDGIRRVDFYAESEKIGEALQPPYELVWTNLLSGHLRVSAQAVDNLGRISTSSSVTVSGEIACAAACDFVREDRLTQGQWKGVYGQEGFHIVQDAERYPRYARVAPIGQRITAWNDRTLDPRALRRSDLPGNVAATWVAPETFDVKLDVADGRWHQVALYCLDWDSNERVERISILDASTLEILDSRVAREFRGGVYLVWNVYGDVIIRVEAEFSNAVLSGLFFDAGPNRNATVRLVDPLDNADLRLPSSIRLAAETFDCDGWPAWVEFFAGDRRLGRVMEAPFELAWADANAGRHTLTARVTDDAGAITISEPVIVEVGTAPARASFLGTDTNRLGSWRGSYGDEGFVLVNDATMIPPHLEWNIDGQESFTWGDHLEDPRALQKWESPLRIAAAWHTLTNMTLDLRFLDSGFHRVSLYFLDWDGSDARSQGIWVLDGETGRLLDRRSVSQFSNGRYLNWKVRGHVRFAVTASAGNAVLSGLFVDRLPSDYALWRSAWFSDSELADATRSGDNADPDLDGLPNLLEFAIGYEPKTANKRGRPDLSVEGDRLVSVYRRPVPDAEVTVSLQVSTDLNSWRPSEAFFDLVSTVSEGKFEIVTVRSRIPASEMGPLFLRLEAVRN